MTVCFKEYLSSRVRECHHFKGLNITGQCCEAVIFYGYCFVGFAGQTKERQSSDEKASEVRLSTETPVENN